MPAEEAWSNGHRDRRRGRAAHARRRALPDGAPVVAADGGIERALALGLRVDLAIGDFDSASRATVEAAVAPAHASSGTRQRRTRPISSSLSTPRSRSARGGSSFSAATAAGSTICSPAARTWLRPLRARRAGRGPRAATVHVVRGERRLSGRGRARLAPRAPRAGRGRDDRGLRYPLHDETLAPGSSRGVSNVFAAQLARISIQRGVLLAIRPGPGGGASDPVLKWESAPWWAARAGRGRVRRVGRGPEGRRARHARLVRRVQARERGLRARDRTAPAHPPVGDAGEALNKALLTAGNPQGDVFFGVDNTLLRERSTRTCSSPTAPRSSPTCRATSSSTRSIASRRSTTATSA